MSRHTHAFFYLFLFFYLSCTRVRVLPICFVFLFTFLTHPCSCFSRHINQKINMRSLERIDTRERDNYFREKMSEQFVLHSHLYILSKVKSLNILGLFLCTVMGFFFFFFFFFFILYQFNLFHKNVVI